MAAPLLLLRLAGQFEILDGAQLLMTGLVLE
jgi:hypothetical protein